MRKYLINTVYSNTFFQMHKCQTRQEHKMAQRNQQWTNQQNLKWNNRMMGDSKSNGNSREKNCQRKTELEREKNTIKF
jgi:hypothetical protein